MMLPFYFLMAFVFYKVMPELMDWRSITVVGSFMMAVVTSVALAASGFATLYCQVVANEGTPEQKRGPWKLYGWLAAIGGVVVSVFVAHIVVIAFGGRFGEQVRSYSFEDERIFYFVILATPPLVHTVLMHFITRKFDA
jgi:hypothetical protein